LAIAFAGLRSPDDRYQFAGRWYLDFKQAPEESDTFIVYKKRSEIVRENLETNSSCISAGLFPLDQARDFNSLSQRIRDKDFYGINSFPDADELNARSAALAKYQEVYTTFQVPFAEIPSTLSLADVCEIFEVLNQTGTAVSIFDLIHNRAFGETSGEFNLRDKFEELRGSPEKLRLLCDKTRPEFLCQLVTGILLSEEKLSRDNLPKNKNQVSSIKGGDLLKTPVNFYRTVFSEIQYVQTATNDLFSDVLKGDFRLKEIPYPVSVIIYLSLRWFRDKGAGDLSSRFTVEQLNRLFTAFFWRNAFTNRYDQGFLTKLSTDLNALKGILERNAKKPIAEWAKSAEVELTEYFSASHKSKSPQDIQEYLLDGGIQGAIRQAIVLYLNSKITTDLVTGEELDRFSDKGKNSVDLHHIFPRQWLSDNKIAVSSNQSQSKPQEAANAIANLIPLSADSNKKWKTKAPHTAIHEFNLTWDAVESRFDGAGISHAAYEILVAAGHDEVSFWKLRAVTLSNILYRLQLVDAG
jgi:hypothetical protein